MSKLSYPYRVARTETGLGLIATKHFEKEEFIIEYVGELLDSDASETRENRYLFDIDEEWTIDGSVRENLARYVNHACRPNCEAEADLDEQRIRFYACRSIEPGEELTIDYGEEYVETYITPYGCKCASCRAKRS